MHKELYDLLLSVLDNRVRACVCMHVLAYTHLMIPSDAFSCKVMLPSDVNASKLKCNVPSSAEKFLLC